MIAALVAVPITVAASAHAAIWAIRFNLIFLLVTPIERRISMSELCCLTNKVMAAAAVPPAKNSTAIDKTTSVSLLMP